MASVMLFFFNLLKILMGLGLVFLICYVVKEGFLNKKTE